jgi:formylglycine-generating enzyme
VTRRLKPLLLCAALLQLGQAQTAPAMSGRPATLKDMSLIPAGDFEMGSTVERGWVDEQPAHQVRLSRAYFIDKTEVTNAQFLRFVQSTGYKTVAERPLDLAQIMAQLPAGAKPPPVAALAPGSLVFVTPVGEVNLLDLSHWWKWTAGASWRAPEGPSSSLKGRSEHPAVHLAWEDAKAFCQWAGKRLPTEAEWERAARGGVNGLPYVWGSDKPNDAARKGWLTNIWQGVFPTRNEATDGFERTAPVRSFKANAYGLYDMAGNVWEWTADWYDADAYVARPGARQGSAVDSGTSHAGVRCAKSAAP